MAGPRVMDVRLSADGARLEWVNRVGGKVEFDLLLEKIAASVARQVFIYGAKQIVQDGGALSEGATLADRLAEMHKRKMSLYMGTWGESRMVDEDTFRACVALGHIPADTVETRKAWRELKNAERAGITKMADVAEWITANTAKPDAAVTKAVLGKFAAFKKS